MATRAEQFRYEAERAGPKRPKRVPHPARATAGSARSESAHAERKASYTLEDSAGRPSRKSSRKASNHQRTDTKTQALQRIAEVRPRPPRPGRR
jgi:hypothetical protein